MNNRFRRAAALLLCLLLILSVPFTAAAEELRISSVEELLKFSENCKTDRYSQGMTVLLDSDLDLSESSFSPIPTFGGVFEGNGHKITGLELKNPGSYQGLFRYLQKDAIIRNLTVEASIDPNGSRSYIGGIVGSNAGRIENCRFSGQVTGADHIGGLAGINEVSGMITDSTVTGNLSGNHFIGGIAGENLGVIRNCSNEAQINDTPAQNNLEISDVTLDSLTDSESAATVTDIGGIAGINTGVIRECQNSGVVGYRQIGYNIGGIAGTQAGSIIDCANRGKVFGRKDIGGIAGQLEPVAKLEYSTDTLQILQGQLTTLDQLADQTAGNAQSYTSSLFDQATALQNSIDQAQQATKQMLPSQEQPLPDADQFAAAKNNLDSSLTAIPGILESMDSTGETAARELAQDLQALTAQITAISDTLNNASEEIGGTIRDSSDLDTPEDTAGKITGSLNEGAVAGDYNVGGIGGIISFESDLDPESDLQIIGNISLNMDLEVRAVIRDSKNSGAVTARKQNTGGIIGWMTLGLVKGCTNIGALETAAEYVGGIAGQSNAIIRQSYAKCSLSGTANIGGIAGLGTTVTDCYSITEIKAYTEKAGGILGSTEDLSAVLYNYYLPVYTDIGGIDGITYVEHAEPLTESVFYSLVALPENFRTVTVRFLFEDGTETALTLNTGDTLTAEQIPALPAKENAVARWSNEQVRLEDAIRFDTVFQAEYSLLDATIQSVQKRKNGSSILLIQGSFSGGQAVTLTEAESPELTKKQRLKEAWSFTLPEGTATQLRYCSPETEKRMALEILVQGADGTWRTVSYQTEMSYLVFEIQEGDQAFCAVAVPQIPWLTVLLSSLILLTAGIGIPLLIKKRKQNKA